MKNFSKKSTLFAFVSCFALTITPSDVSVKPASQFATSWKAALDTCAQFSQRSLRSLQGCGADAQKAIVEAANTTTTFVNDNKVAVAIGASVVVALVAAYMICYSQNSEEAEAAK